MNLKIEASKAPFFIKFGLISIHKDHLPKFFGILSFVISNLQTFGMIIHIADILISEDSYGMKLSFDLIKKIVTFSHFFNYSEDNYAMFLYGIWITIYLSFIYFAIILLSIYIHFRFPIPIIWQQIWATICYFHPYVFFFPYNIFLSKIIYNYYTNELKLLGGLNTGFAVICHINFFSNIIFAANMAKNFNSIIKTKDPLSSKTQFTTLIDLFLKVYLTILMLFANERKYIKDIIMVIIFLGTFLKDFSLFYYLPFYRIDLLEFSIIFSGIQSSFVFWTAIAYIFENSRFNTGWMFLSITWIFFLPFVVKAYRMLLHKILINLLSNFGMKVSNNTGHIIHRKDSFMYFFKKKNPIHIQQNRFDIYNLISEAGKSFVQKSFLFSNTKSSNVSFSEILQYCKDGLVSASQSNPKDLLIKTVLAYHYVKYEEAYLVANELIETILKQNPSFQIQISLGLIRIFLDKKLRERYADADSKHNIQKLDMFKFINGRENFDKLTKLTQIQIKINTLFWNHFLQSTPDMQKLIDLSNSIYKQKEIVKNFWKSEYQNKRLEFKAPCIYYSLYMTLINNDIIEGEPIIKKFLFDAAGETKNDLLGKLDLSNHTIFDPDNVKVVISGSKQTLGKILECSNSIQSIFGYEKDFCMGKDVSLIMPPFYKENHSKFIMNHYYNGRHKILNVTRLLAGYSNDCFLIPVSIHVKMNPYVELGISFIGLMKPYPVDSRIILVRANGCIDSFTKIIGKELGIESKRNDKTLNMSDLCDYDPIHQSFEYLVEKKKIVAGLNGFQLTFTSVLDETKSQTDQKNEIKGKHKKKPGNSIAEIDFSKLRETEDIKKAEDIVRPLITGECILKFEPQIQSNVGNQGLLSQCMLIEPIEYKAKMIVYNHGHEILKYFILEKLKINDKANLIQMARLNNKADFVSKKVVKVPKIKIPSYESQIYGSRLYKENLTDYQDAKIEHETSKLSPKVFGEKINNYDSPRIEVPIDKKILGHGNIQGDQETIEILSSPKINATANKSILRYKAKKQNFDKEQKMKSSGIIKDIETLQNTIWKSFGDLSEGDSSSKNNKNKTMIEHIIKALKEPVRKKSSIIFESIFLLKMCLTLIFMIFLSINCLNAAQETQIFNQVFDYTYLRTIFVSRIMSRAYLFYGVITGYTSFYGSFSADQGNFTIFMNNLLDDTQNINRYLNYKLENLGNDNIKRFYEHDVEMFEYHKDERFTIGKYDQFEATELIFTRMRKSINKKRFGIVDKKDIDDDMKFVMKNCFDNFMISSDNLIGYTSDALAELYSKYISEALILMVVSLVMVFPYIIIAINFGGRLIREAEHFMTIFMKFSTKDAEKMIQLMRAFQSYFRRSDTVDVEFVSSLMSQDIIASKQQIEENTLENHQRNESRKALMGENKKRIYFLLIKIIPSLVMIVLFVTVYYVTSKNSIESLQYINSNKTQSLKLQLMITNFATLIVVTFLDPDSTFKNNPTIVGLYEVIEQMKSPQQIVDNLEDRENHLTDIQKEVLYNFSCYRFDYFELNHPLEYIRRNCHIYSKGTEYVGLLEMITQCRSDGLFFYSINIDPADAERSQIFTAATSKFSISLDLIYSLSEVLTQSSNESFEIESNYLEREGKILGFLSLILIFKLMIFTHYFVIHRITDLDMERKKLFMLLPIKGILFNRIFKKFLIDHSKKTLENIESVFS